MKTSQCPHPNRTAAGFTLIELLTVIAIIGILASILIPVVNRVRASARKAKCSTNLRELTQGWHLFANDHNGRFPVGLTWTHPDLGNYRYWWRWRGGIAPYLPTSALNDNEAPHPPSPSTVYTGNYCPENIDTAIDREYRVSYYFNSDIGFEKAFLVDQIETPSNTPLLFCYWRDDTKSYQYFASPRYSDGHYLGQNFMAGVQSVHGNGANISFVDGSVQHVSGISSREEYAEKFSWKP